MTVLRNEIRFHWKGTLIWSFSLSFFAILALTLYPQVANYSGMFNAMVERMGILGQMFNLQNMDMFEFMNYYGLENGNFLGLGGGMFAAITAMNIVAREEGRHTAEFLFPHPINRTTVLVQKFITMLLQILVLNAIFIIAGHIGAGLIGMHFPQKRFTDFHLSLLMMNLQVAVLCFGISCFRKRDSVVPGLGLVLAFYFVNLFININREVATFKYFTPYYYTDIGRITSNGGPMWEAIGLGFIVPGLILILGILYYSRKDLAI